MSVKSKAECPGLGSREPSVLCNLCRTLPASAHDPVPCVHATCSAPRCWLAEARGLAPNQPGLTACKPCKTPPVPYLPMTCHRLKRATAYPPRCQLLGVHGRYLTTSRALACLIRACTSPSRLDAMQVSVEHPSAAEREHLLTLDLKMPDCCTACPCNYGDATRLCARHRTSARLPWGGHNTSSRAAIPCRASSRPPHAPQLSLLHGFHASARLALWANGLSRSRG